MHSAGCCLGTCSPKFENKNGRVIRQFCQRSSLSIATAFYNIGMAYYGPAGHDSRVDHFIAPAGAIGSVQPCNCLKIKERLQLIKARGLIYHMPVGLVTTLRVLDSVSPRRRRANQGINRDLLMDCLRRGKAERTCIDRWMKMWV